MRARSNSHSLEYLGRRVLRYFGKRSLRPIDAIKARADLVEMAQALGCRVRGSRATAVWREGERFTVSLDRKKGLFYDHKTGQGGDVIALVMLIRGCGFREALRWLADFYGIHLRNRFDAEASRRFREHRDRAERAAVSIVVWRWRLGQVLRAVRNSIWSECNRIESWADAQAGFSDGLRWSDFSRVPDRLRLADAIDAYIAYLESMSAADLLSLRDRLEGAHAS